MAKKTEKKIEKNPAGLSRADELRHEIHLATLSGYGDKVKRLEGELAALLKQEAK